MLRNAFLKQGGQGRSCKPSFCKNLYCRKSVTVIIIIIIIIIIIVLLLWRPYQLITLNLSNFTSRFRTAAIFLIARQYSLLAHNFACLSLTLRHFSPSYQKLKKLFALPPYCFMFHEGCVYVQGLLSHITPELLSGPNGTSLSKFFTFTTLLEYTVAQLFGALS
jgi:hypothetical protein